MFVRVRMFRSTAVAAVAGSKGAAAWAAAAGTKIRRPAASAASCTAATAVPCRFYSSRRYPIPVNPNHRKELMARRAKQRALPEPVVHLTGLLLPARFPYEVNLNTLHVARGKKRQIVGRGKNSTRGDKCGRGMKGRKARGKVPLYYEGGQSTFFRRLPLRKGFKELPPIVDICCLDRIQHWIDTGRLDPSKPITMYHLHNSMCCKIDPEGVGARLLDRGAEYFRTPIQIEVAEASPEAIEAIERLGGSVVCRHYNVKQLSALIKPSLLILPEEILEPVVWQTREYYMKKENRGRLYWDKNPDDPDRDRLFPGELRFTHIQPAPSLASARATKKELQSKKPLVPQ